MNKIFNTRILAGKAILILLPALNLIPASETHAQIIEYAIIQDASKSSVRAKNFDWNSIFRNIITELDLKGSSKGVNFRTALAGENRIPNVRVASLPEQKSMFASTSERNKALGQFLDKGKSDLDYLASQPCDQLQTNLYRTVIHLVGQLDQRATQKRIWIFSDMCESSSAFEADRYSRNPSRIMKDYDAIVAALEADAPLPDMTGIEFILITPGNTDLLLWMSRFWEKLLNSQGASVKVRGSF